MAHLLLERFVKAEQLALRFLFLLPLQFLGEKIPQQLRAHRQRFRQFRGALYPLRRGLEKAAQQLLDLGDLLSVQRLLALDGAGFAEPRRERFLELTVLDPDEAQIISDDEIGIEFEVALDLVGFQHGFQIGADLLGFDVAHHHAGARDFVIGRALVLRALRLVLHLRRGA